MTRVHSYLSPPLPPTSAINLHHRQSESCKHAKPPMEWTPDAQSHCTFKQHEMFFWNECFSKWMSVSFGEWKYTPIYFFMSKRYADLLWIFWKKVAKLGQWNSVQCRLYFLGNRTICDMHYQKLKHVSKLLLLLHTASEMLLLFIPVS